MNVSLSNYWNAIRIGCLRRKNFSKNWPNIPFKIGIAESEKYFVPQILMFFSPILEIGRSPIISLYDLLNINSHLREKVIGCVRKMETKTKFNNGHLNIKVSFSNSSFAPIRETVDIFHLLQVIDDTVYKE